MLDIRKLNVSILIAFDALVTECSVSLAAAKCHVTQAAMSNTLKQLREMFSDPLFIRESRGIRPTPKALSIHKKIRNALSSIEQILVGETFSPNTSDREFHLALSDHGEHLILPELYRHITNHAPSIKLRITPYLESNHDIERLTADVDIAIGTQIVSSESIHSVTLMTETAVCIMRKDHPLADQPLTLQNYLSLRHISVTYTPYSPLSYIDRILRKRQYNRNIAITVPNIQTALNIMKRSDLIGTFPQKLVCGLVNPQEFVFKDPPFVVKDCPILLLCHKRYHHDPAHHWLIEAIKTIANSNHYRGIYP